MVEEDRKAALRKMKPIKLIQLHMKEVYHKKLSYKQIAKALELPGGDSSWFYGAYWTAMKHYHLYTNEVLPETANVGDMALVPVEGEAVWYVFGHGGLVWRRMS